MTNRAQEIQFIQPPVNNPFGDDSRFGINNLVRSVNAIQNLNIDTMNSDSVSMLQKILHVPV